MPKITQLETATLGLEPRKAGFRVCALGDFTVPCFNGLKYRYSLRGHDVCWTLLEAGGAMANKYAWSCPKVAKA